MNRIAIALLLGLSFVACVVCPAMATDETKFDNLIEKYAPESFNPFKPKGACVCLNATLNTNRPGFLERLFGGNIGCSIPTFDSSGTFVGSTQCSPYAVLAR
jgi:hypothetical protein